MTIRNWIKYELKYWPRNFIIGVKNLIKYFPLVWKTRDWDYGYIEKVLLFKLKEHYPVLKNGHAAPLPANPEYWQGVKAMKICITILERRESDFYGYLYKDNYQLKREEDLLNRDWKILCNILNKYFEYWWD